MITPVNFTGKVFLLGSAKETARKDDVKLLKKCAKENDCDIVVFNNNTQKDGSSIFESIIVKKNKETGKNDFCTNVFGFIHPNK